MKILVYFVFVLSLFSCVTVQVPFVSDNAYDSKSEEHIFLHEQEEAEDDTFGYDRYSFDLYFKRGEKESLIVRKSNQGEMALVKPKNALAVTHEINRLVNEFSKDLRSQGYSQVYYFRHPRMPAEFQPQHLLKWCYDVPEDDICCYVYSLEYHDNNIKKIFEAKVFYRDYDDDNKFLAGILENFWITPDAIARQKL